MNSDRREIDFSTGTIQLIASETERCGRGLRAACVLTLVSVCDRSANLSVGVCTQSRGLSDYARRLFARIRAEKPARVDPTRGAGRRWGA